MTSAFQTRRVHIATLTSRACITTHGTNTGDHVEPTMLRILDIAEAHGWNIIPTTTRDRANTILTEITG